MRSKQHWSRPLLARQARCFASSAKCNGSEQTGELYWVATIPVGDTTLPFVKKGQGEAMVFMRGALGDWRTFSPVLEPVATRYCAISFTQRHFGPETPARLVFDRRRRRTR